MPVEHTLEVPRLSRRMYQHSSCGREMGDREWVAANFLPGWKHVIDHHLYKYWRGGASSTTPLPPLPREVLKRRSCSEIHVI